MPIVDHWNSRESSPETVESGQRIFRALRMLIFVKGFGAFASNPENSPDLTCMVASPQCRFRFTRQRLFKSWLQETDVWCCQES